ncbi:glycoside hydrolase family 57 protein [Thiomicrorhabdus xiamenensis]|uniref:Glycoside hydrolase n=1 Tax=Thiomicrorhabdus xiamenensis TaxID=2739063 RepID=A0A7D4TBR2_9GAMM|nr:glycoside hydrolase family 57 protein [Thiomicrorhabdus xiamenensis]QKI89886.1 glycoside hydrolase [Thiomicrorhabdus xiamenensis]
MQENKLKVVLCWHMHQPHYRDGEDGIYRLPWVYLHALKDYTDMVWHLEKQPAAKAVVNFAPVLLEQLDDYQAQIQAWLDEGSLMSDPLLNWVSGAQAIPEDAEQRIAIAEACQKAHAPTIINVFPAFRELVDLLNESKLLDEPNQTLITYLNSQFFTDLLVWYHLAWMGVSLRQDDSRIQTLMFKKRNFSAEDQRLLMQIMADAISGIIPRYKALQDSGQVELSMTPYGHPIVPLLLDFDSLLEAMPNAPMPSYPQYPGGRERAHWHMKKGLEVFEHYFGRKPGGVWLSEGAISNDAIALLDEYKIKWSASGEGVWRHSCEKSHINEHDLNSKKALYRPMRPVGKECSLFFRDDGLSDLIGFQYKDWRAEDAANDFANHLTNIANFVCKDGQSHTVSVILDGENAWEYYPDNAYHFLIELYSVLSDHSHVELTTFSEALQSGVKPIPLPEIQAGSWVYGSFSTWMGDPDKNVGWDRLIEAKQAYDKKVASGQLTAQQQKQATEQLAICEGSDWFWWFGGYNPADSVSDFDLLFRSHLRKLYQILDEPPPVNLETPISFGGGEMENSGTMRRN